MSFSKIFVGVVLTACCLALSAAGTLPMKETIKRDRREMTVMLPMRDGTKLHTIIILPRDDKSDGKYPVVMDRSPYGYYDLEWIADIFLPFGFVSVGQDMRGTEQSEGNFTMWMSDANDSRDLGDWIVQQEWSNGQIMTFGASADGIGSLQTPKSNPSWLSGQYIAWATSKIYQILFPYGTYKQKTAEDWLMGLSMPNPDVVYDNIELVHENEMHSDYWSGVELDENTYKNVNFPNGLWGGWYDLFLLGTIQAFEGYNTQSDPSVRYTTLLLIDPVGHCLEGQDFFTEHTVMGRTAVEILQMFEVFGISDVHRQQIKNITFYVMSSNDTAGKEAGQFWTSMETWPVPKMTDFFFHPDGSAQMTAPSAEETTSTTYKFDPANPQPTMGGNNLPDSIGGSIPCGPLDQASVDVRDDVLTFQTAAFTEELALTGPLFATLYVSSDAIDTDFMVRISDVYPTGEVRLLQDNAVRMRWREDTLTPVYMEPGTIYEVEMNLWNTSYVVAPGHALRFAVSSSNYPRFSVNPNNGILLADANYPGTNITATNTIYHSAQYPSKVTLPVVDKDTQLPEVDVVKETMKAYPHITEDLIRKVAERQNEAIMARRSHK